MVDAPQEPQHGSAHFAQPTQLASAAAWASGRFAAGLQKWRGNRCADGFGILTYHRVAEYSRGVSFPTWNVTPGQLRRQLSGLLERGFEAWPLSRIIGAHAQSQPIPSNVFVVTFDDGYENNYAHALPILRDLNIPATLFLATNYLDTDQPFPFDDWSDAGSPLAPRDAWRPLSTAKCKEMLNSGLIELGAHTHTHARFVGRGDDFRRDLTRCLDVLHERFGITQPAFSFPFGYSTGDMVETTRQLGVSCALSTRRRRVLPGDEPFAWGRFSVEEDDSADVLAAKLSGWYTTVVSAVKTSLRPWTAFARPAVAASNKPLSRSALGTAACSGKASQS